MLALSGGSGPALRDPPDNSDRIGVILASLERPGGGSSKQTVTLYELAAPAMLALDNSPREQLTVSAPTAVSGVVDDLG